jgi:NADH-quinone oxidoreductase subunit H
VPGCKWKGRGEGPKRKGVMRSRLENPGFASPCVLGQAGLAERKRRKMEGRKYLVVRRRKTLGVILPLRIGMAYLTLAERKVMGSIQRRRGPNAVGIYGLFTPLADGRKLLLKETILPMAANPALFRLAPMLTFVLALMGWVAMPRGEGRVYADRNRGVIYRFAVSSLAVYGIMIAGWASNSKYAFLGALRSAAQMVSYEVSIGFIVVSVLICAGSANLTEIVRSQAGVWYAIPLFPMRRRFFVSALAETNRHPFDLPEAEAELVSGYNVEYSAMGFALFFLGEYMNMILMSARTTVRFLGGWLRPFGIQRGWGRSLRVFGAKVTRCLLGFIWARAAYPRYRYDQLMRIGWKVFLPVSLGWVGLTSGVLIGRNGV